MPAVGYCSAWPRPLHRRLLTVLGGAGCSLQPVSTFSVFISQDRESGSLRVPAYAVLLPFSLPVPMHIAESSRSNRPCTCPLSVPAEGASRPPACVHTCLPADIPRGFSSVGEVATQIFLFLLTSKALNLVSHDMAWRKAPSQKHKKSTRVLINTYSVSINKLNKET